MPTWPPKPGPNAVPVHVRYRGPLDCDVTVAGQSIANSVTGLRIDVDPNGAGLTLQLESPTFEIDGEQQVALTDEATRVLVALGWTPPAETAA